MVCGMVKLKHWVGVKAGPWWPACVSVQVSEVGAAACGDDVFGFKGHRGVE